MIWLISFIVFWVGCGILSYGMGFAYWQKEWPDLANEDYEEDRTLAAVVTLLGPLNIVILIDTGYKYRVHGLKWK